MGITTYGQRCKKLPRQKQQPLIDLSIQTGGANTDRVHSGSYKIWIGCISGSGKIKAGVFQFYRFRINPTDLKRFFSELFLFFIKIKIRHIYYLKLSVFNEQVL